MKTCSACGEEKPLDQFHLNTRNRDGRQSTCKPCARAYLREWNAKASREREEYATKDVPPQDELKDRVCKRCGVKKPLGEFHPVKGGRDGIRPECKACTSQRQNESYHRNREQRIEIMRRAYHANLEKSRRYARERYQLDREWGTLRVKLSVHGLTLDQYHALQERQDFSCAICKQVLTDSKEGTHIDHCHTSTRVRGLLCGGCNKGLGQFRDNPEALQSAATYVSARS